MKSFFEVDKHNYVYAYSRGSPLQPTSLGPYVYRQHTNFRATSNKPPRMVINKLYFISRIFLFL